MRRVARRWLTVALLGFMFIVAPAFAMHTVTVCQAGPPTCDASTIQNGVNLADNGSTISVIDRAIYNESVVLPGFNLSLECGGARMISPGGFQGQWAFTTGNVGVVNAGYRIANCTFDGFSTPIELPIVSSPPPVLE